MKTRQTGGTLAGILIGLVIGLGIAIVVAMVVSEMPTPFINTTANTRPSTLDSTEAERNRVWNPNAPLAGAPGATVKADRTPSAWTDAPDPIPEPETEPVAVVPDALDALAAQAASSPSNSTQPPASAVNEGAYQYFVQVGAFRSQSDANAQRARVTMSGWDAHITQGTQHGQPIYRVRVGPFNRSADAGNLKQKLDGQGLDSTVLRQAR